MFFFIFAQAVLYLRGSLETYELQFWLIDNKLHFSAFSSYHEKSVDYGKIKKINLKILPQTDIYQLVPWLKKWIQ